MYELSDKSKYIVSTIIVLTVVLISLIIYNNRKDILEHLDITTTEAIKGMASIYNQDTMVIKKLQTTDTLSVGTNATVALTLGTKDLAVTNNASVSKDVTINGKVTTPELIVNSKVTTNDLVVNGGISGTNYQVMTFKLVIKLLTYSSSQTGNPVEQTYDVTAVKTGKLVTLFIPAIITTLKFYAAEAILPDAIAPAIETSVFMLFTLEGIEHLSCFISTEPSTKKLKYLMNFGIGKSGGSGTTLKSHNITYICK
jgi:hypothetical protein